MNQKERRLIIISAITGATGGFLFTNLYWLFGLIYPKWFRFILVIFILYLVLSFVLYILERFIQPLILKIFKKKRR